MANGNGNGIENNVLFRGVIVAMFAIIMAMAGYIATNLNRNIDVNFDAVRMRIEVEASRIDRGNVRLNTLESNQAIINYRLDHPMGR